MNYIGFLGFRNYLSVQFIFMCRTCIIIGDIKKKLSLSFFFIICLCK